MLEANTEYGKPFFISLLKLPSYMMNIMALRMNLDELEGVNTKRNYKVRDSESLFKNSNIGSHFYFTFATVIRYKITKIGATLLYIWRRYGIPIFGRIVTFCGTLP